MSVWQIPSCSPLYMHKRHRVKPCCHCGWQGTWLSSMQEARVAWAQHYDLRNQ